MTLVGCPLYKHVVFERGLVVHVRRLGLPHQELPSFVSRNPYSVLIRQRES